MSTTILLIMYESLSQSPSHQSAGFKKYVMFITGSSQCQSIKLSQEFFSYRECVDKMFVMYFIVL